MCLAISVGVVSSTGCGRSENVSEGAGDYETGGKPSGTGGSAGHRGGTGGVSGDAAAGGDAGAGNGGTSTDSGGDSGSGGTGGVPEELPFNLDLDVEHWVADDLNRARTFVSVTAWRDDCTNCRTRTDGVCVFRTHEDPETCVCDPPAGSCLERLAVERAGSVVDELRIDRPAPALVLHDLFETEGNTIVVEGCGARVAFPLDTSVAPLPTVLETTLGEDDGAEAPFSIRWTSEPKAALAYLSASDSFEGYTCMFTGEQASFGVPVGTCPFYELSTFALVADTRTALGPTRFIVGQRVRGDIPNDLRWCN
jgi:hypothetical protein